MLPLIETIIAFCAIMLTLSFLVKSLTSLIKNHFDFYSKHLKREVERLIRGTLDKKLEDIQKEPWGKNINWNRLGEEYLTKENMEWVLRKLKAKPEQLENLEGRIAVHLGNIKHAFGKRLKNISLVVGLALCLGLNINAFSIWDTLYSNQQVRATFADSYAQDALDSAKKLAASSQQEPNKKDEQNSPANEKAANESKEGQQVDNEREALQKQAQNFFAQLRQFQDDVNFGMGRIWRDPAVEWWPGLIFEFLGALLTGILISIGAPYWHDLLRVLTNLRQPKKSSKTED